MKKLFSSDPAVLPLLSENDSPALREAYNCIRTNLVPRLDGKRVVGVVTPGNGEGAAAFAQNLAISFARLGMRVLLVDADLRAETAPDIFPDAPGLADAIGGITVTPSKTQEDGLFVLSRGLAVGNPTDLFGRPAFADAVKSVGEGFDLLFLSLPAVNGYADATAAQGVEGYVLLVKSKYTGRQATAAALTALENTGRTLLGFVAAE